MTDPSLKERLSHHLTQIVRERDPYLSTSGHFFVQHYIREELAQWGTVETHDFEVQNRIHSNLVLDLPARSPSSRTAPILVGAHYDAVPGTPGADDNATGVAALLEIARAIAAQPARYPVRCIAFDLEEFGMVGSRAYARALQQQQHPLRLMLSLEMLGYSTDAPDSQQYPTPLLKTLYPNQGNFIALIGNLPTLLDLQHLSHHLHRAGAFSRWLPAGWRGKAIPATRLSDHSPFWDADYRAIMVTDTAFLRNPHYHQASDRIDTLNLDFLTATCAGLIQGIQTLR